MAPADRAHAHQARAATAENGHRLRAAAATERDPRRALRFALAAAREDAAQRLIDAGLS